MYMQCHFCVDPVIGTDIYFNLISLLSPGSSVCAHRQEYVYKRQINDNIAFYGNLKYFTVTF